MTELSQPVSGGYIDKIESEILSLVDRGGFEKLEIEPVHRFVPKGHGLGIYAREITVPEGAMITGKIHKTDHLNILSKGTMTVWHDNEERMTISAPFTFVSRAGARRCGYAHTECVWTTIHGTDETNLDKLEEELIVSPVNLTIHSPNPCLG